MPKFEYKFWFFFINWLSKTIRTELFFLVMLLKLCFSRIVPYKKSKFLKPFFFEDLESPIILQRNIAMLPTQIQYFALKTICSKQKWNSISPGTVSTSGNFYNSSNFNNSRNKTWSTSTSTSTFTWTTSTKHRGIRLFASVGFSTNRSYSILSNNTTTTKTGH